MSDRQGYIELLKSGDTSAFETFVKEFQQFVFTTCLGIVHDKNDADDLTQDVFIETFRSIHTFRSDAKLSTWLCRIAINKSYNFLRDRNRKQFFNRLVSIDDTKLVDASYEMEDEEQAASLRAAALHRAIDALPKNQRTAFVLCKYDELSYKEIAEVMAISLSSVESLLFRARKSLQKRLLAS